MVVAACNKCIPSNHVPCKSVKNMQQPSCKRPFKEPDLREGGLIILIALKVRSRGNVLEWTTTLRVEALTFEVLLAHLQHIQIQGRLTNVVHATNVLLFYTRDIIKRSDIIRREAKDIP